MKKVKKNLLIISGIVILISSYFIFENILGLDFCLACNSYEDKITAIDMDEQSNLANLISLVKSYEIQADDVAKKIEKQEDIILLDVRTNDEHAISHIENSKLLPVDQLNQEGLLNIGLGEDMKNQEIYLYCRSGSRSRTAYELMKSLGYTNVKSIAGGMNYWQNNDLPFLVK